MKHGTPSQANRGPKNPGRSRPLTAEAQQQLWTIAILEHTASEYGPWATRTDLCRSPAGRRLECCQGGTDDGAG